MALKRILIATGLYPPDVGGPATYTKTIEAELPKHGVEVSVVPFSTVRDLPIVVRHLVYLSRLAAQTPRADLVYAQDPVSVGLPACLVAAFFGKPLVLKVVGDYAWEQGIQRFGVRDNLDVFVESPARPFPVAVLRSVERFVARRAVRIVVPSAYLKRIVEKWGIKAGKIVVVYNAFDGPLPSLLPRRPAGEERTVLSAGRLVPWKGFLTLIASMHDLRRHFPNLKLVIAGDGPDRRKLEVAVRDRGLASCVFLAGPLSQEKLRRYIQGADLFVLNTSYEGFSHQLLEVLALGTPVVTTEVGGNPELIEEGVSGLLVPPDDRRALMAAVERVLLDEDLARSLAEAGHRTAATFTVERMVAGTLKVLGEVLSST